MEIIYMIYHLLLYSNNTSSHLYLLAKTLILLNNFQMSYKKIMDRITKKWRAYSINIRTSIFKIL